MVKREKKTIKNYFGLDVECAPLEIEEKKLEDYKSKGLEAHFLPAVGYEDFPKGSLSDYFLKLAKQGSLRKDSLEVSSGWRLVEKAAKPPKKRIWLYKNPLFDFIERLGVEARRLCGLSPNLTSIDWNGLEGRPLVIPEEGRLGISRAELRALLGKEKEQYRLPSYLEYVYLGENFYNNWGETKTWEWLRDQLKDGRYLAAGSKKAKRLGADGPDHWSTILGYRLIKDVKKVRSVQ